MLLEVSSSVVNAVARQHFGFVWQSYFLSHFIHDDISTLYIVKKKSARICVHAKRQYDASENGIKLMK